ncbi:tyrosine integrase [Gordonia phage Dogfish]|nr:tyrosine integrase [Gordonia phage Dogfish]
MNAEHAPTVTLGLTEWELWQHAQRLSRRTIDERLRVLRQLHQETGVQPASIEAIDVVHWISDHDEWSDSTAVTYSSYLTAWFKWLQITDRRLDNPMLKVGTPKTPDREPRPIADADVPKLLGARMWGTTRVMILLALLAGLRVHEIAHIRGEDFDLPANLLWVRGKGRKVKSVPLHPMLREIASEMPETGWWFPMRGHPSEHVLPKSVSDIVGRTMRRAGVRGTPHALRHWFASALHDDGHDIRVVQELMRHKSIASTQIYTKVPDHRRRAAIAGLDPMRGFRRPTTAEVPGNLAA